MSSKIALLRSGSGSSLSSVDSALEETPLLPLEENVALCAQRLLGGMQPSRRALRGESLARPLSCTVGTSQDVVTDISSFIRFVPGVACNALDATIGSSTAENMFLGADGYIRATRVQRVAERVGFTDGVRAAQANRVRCVVQGAGGGLYFGVRGLTLASVIKGVDASSITAPTLLGKITFVFSSVGAALWGLFYLLLAIWNGAEIYSSREVRRDLAEAVKPGPDQALRYMAFIEKWGKPLTEEQLHEQISAKYTPEQLRNIALEHGAEFLEEALGMAGLDTRSQAEREALARHIFDALPGEGDEVRPPTDQMLEELGFKWVALKLEEERHLKLASATSESCAREIESLGRTCYFSLLHGRILVAPARVKEIKPLLERMDKITRTNFWLNAGYIATCALGIVATILAFVLTGGMGPLIVALLFLLVSTAMIVLDGYRFHFDLQNSQSGTFDKKLLGISSGIGLVSLAGSIALIGVLSLGIVPLIGAIVVGVLWLAINTYTWHTLLRHESDHPTLVQFRELLDAEVEDVRIQALFLNLRRVDQQAIAEALHGPDADKTRGQRIKAGRKIFKADPKSMQVKAAVSARIQMLHQKAVNKQLVLQEQARDVQVFQPIGLL